MATKLHDKAGTLKALQDDIYREKILRARKMTGEERFNSALELTNGVFARMLEGAMWQLDTDDPEGGWAEVRLRLERLSKVRDQGRFTNTDPRKHDG